MLILTPLLIGVAIGSGSTTIRYYFLLKKPPALNLRKGKISIWTFEDMSVDNIAKFANNKGLQHGNLIVIPLSQRDYCRVIYISAKI